MRDIARFSNLLTPDLLTYLLKLAISRGAFAPKNGQGSGQNILTSLLYYLKWRMHMTWKYDISRFGQSWCLKKPLDLGICLRWIKNDFKSKIKEQWGKIFLSKSLKKGNLEAWIFLGGSYDTMEWDKRPFLLGNWSKGFSNDPMYATMLGAESVWHSFESVVS